MTKRIDVPLTAFRTFVTAGRHGNFSRAAEALGITQSAVSRQISNLEALTATRLFRRKGVSLVFTSEGQQLYEAIKDAISTLELAAQRLSQRKSRHDRLIVRTSMPSFAMKVVVPFLGTYASDSGVQVDLVTSLATPHPQDEFDVLITRNLNLPETESWELVREKLVCVGSPTRVLNHSSEQDHRWPMIACRLRPDVIASWAVAKEIPAERLATVATYDHFFLAVEAAIGGFGLLVVPEILVRDHLAIGLLALADTTVIASAETYYAYVNPQSKHIQLATSFCRWLKIRLRDSEY